VREIDLTVRSIERERSGTSAWPGRSFSRSLRPSRAPSAGAPASARSRALSPPGRDGGVLSAATGNATPLGRYRGSQSQSLLNGHGLEVDQTLSQSFRYDASNRELEIAVCEAVNAARHMTLLQSPRELCSPKTARSPLAASITARGSSLSGRGGMALAADEH
jgi:hypothetical protein